MLILMNGALVDLRLCIPPGSQLLLLLLAHIRGAKAGPDLSQPPELLVRDQPSPQTGLYQFLCSRWNTNLGNQNIFAL